MGAGARTAEAERIQELMEQRLGFSVDDLLDAYGDGCGGIPKAAFHLGTKRVEEIVTLLGDEGFKKTAEEEHDVCELTWYLKEQLEELLADKPDE